MKHTHEYIVNLFCSCILLICAFYFSSCKKFVQVPPPVNQVGSATVFQDDASATSAVTGIYSEMMSNSNQFTTGNTTFYAGMSADELYYYTTSNRDEFVKNQITETNHGILSSFFWDKAYKNIYAANLCIEGIGASSKLSPSVRNTLLGEAKFIRAFCFFYLVNCFGDVPLTTTSDYNANTTLPRTSTATVYQRVIADLQEAQNLLPVSYASADKTRPNKWAAAALLARVFLYTGDYLQAEAQANAVINSGTYSLVSNLNNVFLKSSTETLWQLYPVNTTWNTWEARDILPSSAAATPQYLITPNLMNAFQPGDARKAAWTASRVFAAQTVFYPYKYKVYGNGAPQTEYYVVLRLAEQYLIRAEARARQNNIAGVAADLNIIRTRATLPNTTASDQASVLSAIEQERRIELMCEWGDRWFDLKRTNRVNAVIGALKPATWQPTDALWPIPVSQLNANPFLAQNPGY
jgi:hypothetical protein